MTTQTRAAKETTYVPRRPVLYTRELSEGLSVKCSLLHERLGTLLLYLPRSFEPRELCENKATGLSSGIPSVRSHEHSAIPLSFTRLSTGNQPLTEEPYRRLIRAHPSIALTPFRYKKPSFVAMVRYVLPCDVCPWTPNHVGSSRKGAYWRQGNNLEWGQSSV